MPHNDHKTAVNVVPIFAPTIMASPASNVIACAYIAANMMVVATVLDCTRIVSHIEKNKKNRVGKL